MIAGSKDLPAMLSMVFASILIAFEYASYSISSLASSSALVNTLKLS